MRCSSATFIIENLALVYVVVCHVDGATIFLELAREFQIFDLKIAEKRQNHF